MKLIQRTLLILFTLVILVNQANAQDKKTILFFGNSLTAGLGVTPQQSFPGIIQQKLKASDYDYQVVNAGLSGETTAGGLGRIDWILKNNHIDIFVLELGANDGLRGLDVSQTESNLSGIIKKVRDKYPDVTILLAGMQMPPNLGKTYADQFQQTFKNVAKKENVKLIPFLLEGVGGNPKYNQSDGIHPNVEGHKILAENVWKVLKEVI